VNQAQRQVAHAIASIAVYACALTLVVVFLPHAIAGASPESLGAMVAGLLALAIVAQCGLAVRGLRIRRGAFSSEIIHLDAPIVVSIFVVIGAEAAAIAALGGFTIAAIFKRRSGQLDLLRQGAIRALLLLACMPVRNRLIEVTGAPTPVAVAAFAAVVAVASALVVLLAAVPFFALRTQLSAERVLGRLAGDRRLWIELVATILWSYATVHLAPDGSAAALLALWIPVVIAALLMRRLDEQGVEIHRLRLVRDAMQAMLGARDTLPQINAILRSLHGALPDESIAILAANPGPVETWQAIASLGQSPTPADMELRRRALARLKFTERAIVTMRDEYAALHAFAVRPSDEGELLGALIVRRKNDPLAESDQEQFGRAAREIAPLLRDLRSIAAAQSAATTDTLTGLKNRAAIFERLRAMLADMMGGGAVLLLDIDHFKRVNDLLGHAAGDECLRRIAEVAIASVRGGDTVGRIGGEEFLVVMPRATSDAAMMVGERLRLAVALSGLRHADGEPVTASIGVAAAATGDTAETLLERADRALYQAKQTGRNRIVEGVEETA
jgi:diguanylate cyclase (GGDEF)-like protein